MVAKFLHKILYAWPKVLLSIFVLLLVWYPLSAILREDIDRTIDYDFDNLSVEQSSGVEMMALLIDREVNQNLWVANLPAFFPSSYLDNMPNFQIGVMQAIAGIAKTLPKQIKCFEQRDEQSMNNIAALLDYPADVWIFANRDNLKIAPSSSRQYRKALKRLHNLNDDLKQKKCLFHGDEKSLSELLVVIEKALGESVANLDEYIEKESDSWMNTKVDNVFYFNVGRIYAYALVLKKFGIDYQKVLESKNIDQDWNILFDNLRKAFEIAPKSVINAKLNDAAKANHLVYLGYYIAKAKYILMEIIRRID